MPSSVKASSSTEGVGVTPTHLQPSKWLDKIFHSCGEIGAEEVGGSLAFMLWEVNRRRSSWQKRLLWELLLHLFRKVKRRNNTRSTFPAGREGDLCKCFPCGEGSIGYQGRLADPEKSGRMEVTIEDTLRLLNSLVFKKAIYFCWDLGWQRRYPGMSYWQVKGNMTTVTGFS